jgi:hypothetical protein
MVIDRIIDHSGEPGINDGEDALIDDARVMAASSSYLH